MVKKINTKGGEKTCCDELISYIDIAAPVNGILKGFFTPINVLIKIILSIISVVIKHWNTQVHTLSFILERFVNLFIYMINGYLNVLSLVLSEVKVILKFSLLALKYNPFVIFSALAMPVISEFLTFFSDSLTVDIFTDLFQFKTKRLVKLFYGSYSLLTGKTIKSKCDINDYSSYEEMKENCQEHYVPKCSLNLSTIWSISFYTLIIIYIGAWYSFLKIFYSDSTNLNFVDYILINLNLIDSYELSDLKIKNKDFIK